MSAAVSNGLSPFSKSVAAWSAVTATSPAAVNALSSGLPALTIPVSFKNAAAAITIGAADATAAVRVTGSPMPLIFFWWPVPVSIAFFKAFGSPPHAAQKFFTLSGLLFQASAR